MPAAFALAALIVLVVVGWLEWRLGTLGYAATPQDTPSRWARERLRVGDLPQRAAVIVGSSRAQLGVSPPTLAAALDREALMLAMDGSGFAPALADLAYDDAVQGNVIVVDYDDGAVDTMSLSGTMADALAATEQLRRSSRASSTYTEPLLAESVRARLRSFADGATPMLSLTDRVATAKPAIQYLTLSPDRSRAADYSRVPMPRFALMRALRDVGEPPELIPTLSDAEMVDRLNARVPNIQPNDGAIFDASLPDVVDFAKRLQARGNIVVFVRLPVDGVTKYVADHRFPRERFWDRFTAAVAPTGAIAFRSDDVPSLAGFRCPDGSHLDQRDRVAFTQAMAEEIARRLPTSR